MRLCRGIANCLSTIPPDDHLNDKPLSLKFRASAGTYLPLTANAYVFQATQHPSERQKGTHRIQLTHVQRGELGTRYYFDRSNEAGILLVGYVSAVDVWILWDADLHDREGFAYSRGVQAPPDLVYEAAANGVAEAERVLKGEAVRESMVASTSAHLPRAMNWRFKRSYERMTGVRSGTA